MSGETGRDADSGSGVATGSGSGVATGSGSGVATGSGAGGRSDEGGGTVTGRPAPVPGMGAGRHDSAGDPGEAGI